MEEHPKLLGFLNELRMGKIHHRLSQHRDDAIMVEVTVPGERWEVDSLSGGSIDVEVFKSDGSIHDSSLLSTLLAKHSDPSSDIAHQRATPVVNS